MKNNLHIRKTSLSLREQMDERRELVEKKAKVKLAHLASPDFDIEEVSSKNCENLIGKIEIPLGVAGPLTVHGDFAKGEFYVPLATTEGALVASVNRGCKAVRLSGGVNAYIEKRAMTRAPVFRTKSLKESIEFVKWIESHFKEIGKKVKETSPFIKLLSIKPFIAGRNVYLRFSFDTADAMGMNMATFACDHAIDSYISERTKVQCLALSGNVCTDKKASWINKIEGRGHSVHAEAVIPKAVVHEVLKTKPERILEVYSGKILVGSGVSGSMGINAHHANIIAAIFAATGQDLAHVVEGSLGMTLIELSGEDLYIAVSIPSLVLGTVGGGTDLYAQKEALSIMGVEGGGKPPGFHANKFAEIVVSATLCGELSLLSAFAAKDLAKAHKKYGRREKI